MKTRTHFLIAGLALVAVGLIAFIWSQQSTTQPLAPAPQVLPIAGPEAVSAPSAPPIRHPISAASAVADSSEVPARDVSFEDPVRAGLIALAGREAALSFLLFDGFVHRLVATVDNLDRPHAPHGVWPVNPTADRFATEGVGVHRAISPSNALRYAAFVQFVESIDAGRAVTLYVRLYPSFQRVYEELGYPKAYFNDRLVDIIDHLLATPDLAPPPRVTLIEVKGPMKSARPWVHYAFSDPSIESRSAGQKMLLRMGQINQRRLKTRLGEFRRLLAGEVTAR